MISQTAEYALRTVVFLATVRGRPATNRQIAAATRVPEGYLAKILQGLSRAGLVQSQRGLHGGSVLVTDPKDLSVFDVVDAVAPIPRITTCPLGLESHGANLCPLHRRLDDAAASVEKAFRRSTIAELLSGRESSIPLGSLPDDAMAATRAAESVFAVATRPIMPTIRRKNATRDSR
jgi:Rrf2 family nitric oxide-sensitive transcriptional repressor